MCTCNCDPSDLWPNCVGKDVWNEQRAERASRHQRLSHALKALLEVGPHQPFPAFQIDPDWSTGTLADVMRHYDLEAPLTCH